MFGGDVNLRKHNSGTVCSARVGQQSRAAGQAVRTGEWGGGSVVPTHATVRAKRRVQRAQPEPETVQAQPEPERSKV